MKKDLQNIQKKLMTDQALSKAEQITLKNMRILKQLQRRISQTVVLYTVKERIGFTELMQRMQSNPRQMYKILKGEGNLTLSSIVELATFMNKNVEIIFKSNE